MQISLKITDLEYSLYVALPFLGIVLATSYGASAAILRIARRCGSSMPSQPNRNNGLDGLRGVLALGVFMHHSFTAYGYFMRGQWSWSSSPLFNHLGQSTVALFFMITGYLFSQKLIMSRLPGQAVEWSSLYVSRFARLVPLYGAIVSAVFISVFLLDWTLREPLATIAREFASWCLFVMPGRPDINRFPATWTLIAGVNWSLKYEWYFYLGLPLLYWPLRMIANPKGTRIAIGLFTVLLLVGIALGREMTDTPLYVLHFACGIVAALWSQDHRLRRVISSRMFRASGMVALALLGLLPNAHSMIAVGLTLVFFLTILGGETLGGYLTLPAAIWLGEISYGVYLIHGLVIFWTLYGLKAWGILPALDLMTYTAIVAAMAMIIVAVASLSYIYLETSAIEWSRGFAIRRKRRGMLTAS